MSKPPIDSAGRSPTRDFSEGFGFFDGTCSKCGARIGWSGKASDMPPCKRCAAGASKPAGPRTLAVVKPRTASSPRAAPTPEERERDLKVLRSLASPKCPHCGEAKRETQSFCRECYWALPQAMRRALYDPIGGGYAEAFDAAMDWLKSGA